jgi:hypothetical protein
MEHDPHLVQQLQATTKASLIIDLATISLLVDKGLITPDELIERIEGMYNRMDRAQSPDVLLRLEGILDELRARPGSTA